MIALDSFFENFGSIVAPLCDADAPASDLARASDIAVSRGARAISVDSGAVATVWPWLENTGVEIAARIHPEISENIDSDARISELARQIKAAFNNGADSVQVSVRPSRINDFASSIMPIRDDLFFNKKLSIVMDLSDIEPSTWADVFDSATRAGADSIALGFRRDTGDKSDFVGRIYGMLNAADSWHGAVHFMFSPNPLRIDQAYRLMSATRFVLAESSLFFISC